MPPPPVPLDDRVLQEAASAFGMLAAPARIQILWLLAGAEHDVGSLATELGQTVAAVSQHLAKLKLAGLVTARRSGRRQIYVLTAPHVVEAISTVIAALTDEPALRGRHLA